MLSFVTFLTLAQLLRRGADPNGSVFPDSILATAVTQHCVDMVEALLARGADPSLRRPCVHVFMSVYVCVYVYVRICVGVCLGLQL